MNPQVPNPTPDQPLNNQPTTVYPQQPSPTQPPGVGPGLPPMPPPNQPTSSRSKLLLIVGILLLVIAVGAAYAVMRHSKNQNTDIGGSASLNGSSATTSTCIPIISTTLDTSSLTSTYEKFAKAVADNNQTCANGLSTSFFMNFAKQEFGASDGKWISAKVTGHESMSDDFSQLPTTLNATKFTTREYTRATIAGSSDQTPTTGTTMSYPIDLSKYTGDSQKQQATISMVLDNGSVKVDNLEIDPPQQGN